MIFCFKQISIVRKSKFSAFHQMVLYKMLTILLNTKKSKSIVKISFPIAHNSLQFQLIFNIGFAMICTQVQFEMLG